MPICSYFNFIKMTKWRWRMRPIKLRCNIGCCKHLILFFFSNKSSWSYFNCPDLVWRYVWRTNLLISFQKLYVFNNQNCVCECVVKSNKNIIYSDVWIIYDFVIGAITSYLLRVVFACHIVMFIHLQLLYDILTQPKSFDIVCDNNNVNRSNHFKL